MYLLVNINIQNLIFYNFCNDLIYLCSKNKCFMNIKANLFLYKINCYHIHIICVSSYKYISPFSYKSALLVFLVYIITYYNWLSLLTLEVSVYNSLALSLYCWLGFQFLAKRSNYYAEDQYKFASAYNLINSKFVSKNILRRYLIFNTI